MKPLLALVLPLALAACSPGTNDAAPPATPSPAAAPAAPGTAPAPDLAAMLGAHHWQLDAATAADGSRIDALFANTDAALQLDFADGRISVSNACNRMGGDFNLEADAVAFGPMVSTQMACAEPLMAMEREAHTRLSGSHALALDGGEPPRLALTNGLGDRLVFIGAPTARTRHGGEPERVFLEVAAERVDCHHPLMPEYRCLQVREIHYDDSGLKQGSGEWGPMYEEIEGFEHTPGVRTVLRLDRYQRQNVPADASAVVHVLDMVVEQEQVAAAE
ncbi:DUF4377 domain-containing protein [Luteimonas sp. A534]